MSSFIDDFNKIGKERNPTLFIIDYQKEYYHIYNLEDLLNNKDNNILFEIADMSNISNIKDKQKQKTQNNIYDVEQNPISFNTYKEKFDTILNHIKDGNSYLLNLTQPTILKSKKKLDLKEIFYNNQAPFKLYFSDDNISFVCNSPEEFVSISNNTIYTYPMKGTIEIKDDKKLKKDINYYKDKLLNNPKEIAEHTMIVDLLRNDLGKIGSQVRVEDFRYISKIKAGKKELLQTSSKISAKLNKNWQDRLGDILDSLLPAGSITGTPKSSTMKIIEEIEGYDRGYFSGIFGYFDGKSLKSAVMIRYIEQDKNSTIYKSGGGITCDSKVEEEYQEMLDKIYF